MHYFNTNVSALLRNCGYGGVCYIIAQLEVQRQTDAIIL